jgi:hypothetical protein
MSAKFLRRTPAGLFATARATNGVKIDEPICQKGVKIPDPDWSRMEPAHAE